MSPVLSQMNPYPAHPPYSFKRNFILNLPTNFKFLSFLFNSGSPSIFSVHFSCPHYMSHILFHPLNLRKERKEYSKFFSKSWFINTHFGFVNSNVGFPVVPYNLPVVVTLMKLRVLFKMENFMSN